MESLKIRDKKAQHPEPEQPARSKEKTNEPAVAAMANPEVPVQQHTPEETAPREVVADKGRKKLTFGESLLDKVKKFFEEVE